MAGCATPTSSAGHTNRRISAAHELTLQPDHSMGAGHSRERLASIPSDDLRPLRLRGLSYRRVRTRLDTCPPEHPTIAGQIRICGPHSGAYNLLG